MNEILDETIDRALWRALRYQQGKDISQAPVGDSRSLVKALDAAAAGRARAEGEAEDLWSRAGKERALYFTPTGRATAERTDLAGQLERAREDVARLTQGLAELEAAAEAHRRLKRDLAQTVVRLADQQTAVREQEAEWSELQAVQREVERLGTEAERLGMLANRAATAHQQRQDLIERLRVAREALVELSERAKREAPAWRRQARP